MFNNKNYRTDIFTKENRINHHLELMADKLQGISVVQDIRLFDFFENKKIRQKIIDHCANMELNDPVVSNYPEVNIQMLSLCLEEGVSIDNMSSLVERGPVGLRVQIQHSIAKQGWMALDAAFKDPLCEQACNVQRQLANHCMLREEGQGLFFSNTIHHSFPGSFLNKAVETSFLAIAAKNENYPFIEADRTPRLAIQCLVGSAPGDRQYHPYEMDQIRESVRQVLENPSLKELSFNRQMRFLDGLSSCLANYFVSTWMRQGISLDELHVALVRRLDALFDGFGVPEVLMPHLMAAAVFRAFVFYPDSWERFSISWAHGLGLPLECWRYYKPRYPGSTEAISPMDDLPGLSRSGLAYDECTPIYRALHQALMQGLVKPEDYVHRYGSYLISPHLMGDERGHELMRTLCHYSPYLSMIVPEGLHSEYMVQKYPYDDSYQHIMVGIGKRILSGKASLIYVGGKKMPCLSLIRWLKEARPQVLAAAFCQVEALRKGNIEAVVELFGMSAADFTEGEVAGFSGVVRRALLMADLDV
jgi:hypothetical protein